MDLKGRWISDLGNGRFRNPVLYADYSDPDIVRVGEDFYMTASSFTYVPGLPILHSKDLVNWEIINYAVKELQPIYDKPRHGCGVWAPSIRYHNGKFWIFYGDPDLGIMMTNTDDIYGEWSPLTCVKEAVGIIDTCPLWDDDGKAYIVHGYANSRCGIKSKIAVCEMSQDGTKVISEDTIVFDGTVSHPTLEGPKFYKRNGYYYIMAPAGGVPTGWEVVFRSKNVYGPYEDRIVLRQGKTDINGPHQGGWVELENGESWFVHFQDLEVYGRVVHIQPVTWINDWPAMGENVDSGLCGQPVLEYEKPNVGKEYPVTAIAASDDFSSDTLGLQWQWQANNCSDWYSLTENPGNLRLYGIGAKDEDAYMWNLPNVLTQLWQAPSMITTVKISMPKGTGKNKAALGVAGLKYGYIAIKDNGTVIFVKGETSGGGAKAKEYLVADKIITETSVYLRTEVIGHRNAMEAKVVCSYSLEGKHFSALGEFDAMQGKWVGAKHAIFVTGEQGSYADFSDFKVM